MYHTTLGLRVIKKKKKAKAMAGFRARRVLLCSGHGCHVAFQIARHFEPSVDALSLRPDVISAMKILPLDSGTGRIASCPLTPTARGHRSGANPHFLIPLSVPQVAGFRPPPVQITEIEEGVENNHFAEMCSGSEAGSYPRLLDLCITQL